MLQCGPSTLPHQYCSSLLNAPGCRYRLHVTETVANGLVETVRPYLIDLETTNGLFSPALSFARQTVAVLTRRCPAELPLIYVTPLAGTYLKSGPAWERIDVARYYEMKDGTILKTAHRNPVSNRAHRSTPISEPPVAAS